MKAKIWYLYNSGFAVQTDRHFLVFDYWRKTPKGGGLDSGVVDIKSIRDQDVIIFVSHRHGDHFNKEVLDWHKEIPKCRLILSDDIPADISTSAGACKIGPGATLTRPDFTVQTFLSTDEGLAFVLEIDDLRIYHAGDLSWWHWEGDPEADNARRAADYKTQIALLPRMPYDLAFIPLDPRLGDQYAWAFDHLMRSVDVCKAVPMHFRDNPSVVDRLLRDPVSTGYRDRVLGLLHRGASAEI